MPVVGSALSTGSIAFVPASAAALPASGTSATSAFQPASAAAARALDRFVPSATSLPPTTTSAPASAVADAVVLTRERPILLFNDQCEVCRALSSWVKKNDAAGKDLIDERPIGDDPAALKALDPRLDIWDVYKEIHLLMPDGTIHKGGAAIGEVLKRLPHLRWATWTLDLSLFGIKPFQAALDVAYKILDAARPAIGCKSCGGGPVVWWSMPIKWVADLVRALAP